MGNTFQLFCNVFAILLPLFDLPLQNVYQLTTVWGRILKAVDQERRAYTT